MYIFHALQVHNTERNKKKERKSLNIKNEMKKGVQKKMCLDINSKIHIFCVIHLNCFINSIKP